MKKKIPSEKEIINDVVLGSKDPAKNPPDPAEAESQEEPEEPEKPEETKPKKKTKEEIESKKKTSGIIMLIIGLFTFVVGGLLLIKTLTSGPAIIDGDFLVEVGQWQRSDEPTVIWNFTEIGKGTLTTNNHTNDYNFIWNIDSGKINFETNWLYTLNDTYTYKLDQSKKILTLYDDAGEILYTFIPLDFPDVE